MKNLLVYTLTPTTDPKARPYYLRIKQDNVSLTNTKRTPLCLTYVFEDAAAITFALEFCESEEECLAAIMLHLPCYTSGALKGQSVWKVEKFNPLKGSN